jgi:hypothetical protein
VADEDDRPVDLADDGRDVGGVTGKVPVRYGRDNHRQAIGEQLGNDGGEARGVGESAVNEDDGGRGVGRH